jgi:RNA polymerase subunit RPABC4/transcription elongation factor Spt4
MKYCYECGRMTAGEPRYCQFCGRTYDVKLCPRKHVNPRSAEVCSACGSRELSTPQPQVPFRWRALEFFARVTVVLLIAYVLLAFGYALFTTAETAAALMALGLLLGGLSVLWMMLPEWFRRFVRWSWGKGRRDEDR